MIPERIEEVAGVVDLSFLGLVNFNEQIQPWWVRKMRESSYTPMTNLMSLAS